MISGIKSTSLIDYPGKIAAVIYTTGCNFRCPFCHNGSLALGINNESVSRAEAVEYLASRRGFIDGVVVTGGEPCLHSGLGELLASVRGLGFSIKLDTNGYFPEALRGLIDDNLIDYIAMDIKTAWHKYKQAAGVDVDVTNLKRSVDLIKHSGIECEFRTTCVPLLVNAEDIEAISRIAGESARYTLQQFQPVDTLNPKYKTLPPYPAVILHDFWEIARRNAPSSRLIGV